MKSISLRIKKRDALYLRDLVSVLVTRDLKARYKDAALGIAWAVINPLLYLLIFYFLFQLVFSLDIRRYSSFAFSGLLVWTWFQASVNQATLALKQGQDVVKQPRFPVAVLPMISVTTNLINFLISLPLLLVIMAFEDAVLGVTLLYLPLLIAVQFVFTLGLSYLVAALNIPFPDTKHVLAVGLQLFFFITPIFYDASSIPEAYQWIYQANPLAHLIDAYRAVLLHHTAPAWGPLTLLGATALVCTLAGYKAFAHASYKYMEAL